MTNEQIIRAWKDDGFRSSLSEAERAMLPANPAGMAELPDEELNAAGGIVTLDIVCIVTWDFTCFGNCQRTIDGGSCPILSVVCCGGPIPI